MKVERQHEKINYQVCNFEQSDWLVIAYRNISFYLQSLYSLKDLGLHASL